jgi:hypothetical protein
MMERRVWRKTEPVTLQRPSKVLEGRGGGTVAAECQAFVGDKGDAAEFGVVAFLAVKVGAGAVEGAHFEHLVGGDFDVAGVGDVATDGDELFESLAGGAVGCHRASFRWAVAGGCAAVPQSSHAPLRNRRDLRQDRRDRFAALPAPLLWRTVILGCGGCERPIVG